MRKTRLLTRLKHEIAFAREQQKNQLKTEPNKNGAARIATVHVALRDWIEPKLPSGSYALLGAASRLQASLPKMLEDAGALRAESTEVDFDDPGFDGVSVELKTMPELPDMLFVIAGVSVPCGEDEAIYGYRFDGNGRSRVIEDHPSSDDGYAFAKLELSDPDLQGRRILLIHRMSTQCASTWMEMTYAVYRLSSLQPPESLLSSKHGFWLGNDGPEFLLKSDELIVEFLDRSIDIGIHNRTHIFRYNFANGLRRLEPFAFQPQDFVEEWLTGLLNETQSTLENAELHRKLRDVSFDQYSNVVSCAAKPGHWVVGLQSTYNGEKEREVPVEIHFLIRDFGNYRFEMEGVSTSKFEGCPGEGSPSDQHPWLSVEQLRALP